MMKEITSSTLKKLAQTILTATALMASSVVLAETAYTQEQLKMKKEAKEVVESFLKENLILEQGIVIKPILLEQLEQVLAAKDDNESRVNKDKSYQLAAELRLISAGQSQGDSSESEVKQSVERTILTFEF